MNKIINVFVLSLATSLLVSCYEDKGNYDYRELDEVNVSFDSPVCLLPPKGKTETLIITPVISRKLTENNESDLEFLWEKGSPELHHTTDYKEFSRERNGKLVVTREDVSGTKIRLTVIDKKEGIKWYAEGKLTINLPYSSTWFVLEDNNGKALISAIDNPGDMKNSKLIKDVYKREYDSEYDIVGKPLSMSALNLYGFNQGFYSFYSHNRVKRHPVFTVATDKDINIFNATTIYKEHHSNEMFLYPVKIDNQLDRNISHYQMTRAGEIAIDNGQLYWTIPDGHSVMFKVTGRPDGENSNNVEITHITEYNLGLRYLIYDKGNSRFYYIHQGLDPYDRDIQSKYASFTYKARDFKQEHLQLLMPSKRKKLLVYQSEEKMALDPNNLTKDNPNLEVLGLIRDKRSAIAVITDGTESSVKLFRIFSNSDEGNIADNLLEVEFPAEVDKVREVQYISSYAYSDIMFAAYKNVLYKINLKPSGKCDLVEIYRHSNPNVKIKKMKFRDNKRSQDWSYHENCSVLGLLVEYSEQECGVIELDLNIPGDVKPKEGSIREHTGFGKAVDFAYSFLDENAV